MKKISVIIPVKNRGENLKKNVKSLLRQTFDKKDFEIIVVDYGGEDNSEEMLKKFKDKRIKYIYVDRKGIWNPSHSRNIGIKSSKGELIICVDADMVLAPEVLEVVYEDFKKREKSVFYQMAIRNIMKDGSIKLYPAGVFAGYFYATNRKNWFKVRGFDERMAGYGYEDEDLIIRMKRIGVLQYGFPLTLKIFHQYHEMSPGEETYVNRLKSLLNFSYEANDENWGSTNKKKPKISIRLWKIFDKISIFLIIQPIKKIKRKIREIKKVN